MTRTLCLIRVGDAHRLTQGVMSVGLPEDFLPGYYMPA